ncbi:hypothetical protein [Microbulbifer sp. TYP-18]|uniref:hypothetical protein n=1 Tax=Microbulbifer sp. TYP-18 TaxID=3230024 RepID=UPI0034C5BA21
MSEQRLIGNRVLVTRAEDYMGPATIELFAARDGDCGRYPGPHTRGRRSGTGGG